MTKYDLSFLELELRELLKKLKKHNTYAVQLEDEIRLYALENARLKESEEYHRKGYAELHKRIDEAIEYLEYYFAKGKTKNNRQFDLSLYEILTGKNLFNFTRKEKDQFFKEKIKSDRCKL